MDERQARQFVRNQFRLLDLSKIISQRADGPLNEAIISAARLIATLPPAGDLFRERAWKEMKPRVQALFDKAAASLGREVVQVLTDEVKAQVDWAAAYVNGGKIPPIEWTPGKNTLNGQPLTGTAIPSQPGPGFGLGSSTATPSFAQELTAQAIGATGPGATTAFTAKVPPSIVNVVKDVRIAGATLERTFGRSVVDGAVTVGDSKTGLGKFFLDSVDRRVRQGFLMGQTTEEISQELFIDAIRRGQLGPTAVKLKRGATAVARTAVQDLATQVHEKFWDANDELLSRNGYSIKYEFDASSDSRTCPTCTALDGKIGPKDEIPRPPIHPQCRCAKLPVTRTEEILRARGDVPNGTGVELVAVDEMPIAQRKGERQRDYIRRVQAQAPKNERWYLTPANQNGQRFYRRARDRNEPGGVVKFLADKGTTDSTLDQAFGGGESGIIRRKWFRQQLAKGVSPQVAYSEMLSFRGMTNRSVTPERLAKLKPLKDLPGADKIKVTSGDRHRPISRSRRPRQQRAQP